MAATTYTFTDPRAQKIWWKQLFRYALSNMKLIHLVGTGPTDAIIKCTDLTSKAGGDVVAEIPVPASGGGVGDDGSTIGSEEAMTYGNQTIRVHERAHATVSNGMLSEQLTSVRGSDAFRSKARVFLGDLLTEWHENDLITCLCGLYNENSGGSAIETVNEQAPTTNRVWYGGQSVGATPALGNSGASYGTDALLTAGTQASNLFGTLVGQQLRAMAIEARPRIRPCRFSQPSPKAEEDIRPDIKRPGNDVYVLLAHPKQFQTMKSEIGTSGFNQLLQLTHAQGFGHPLLTGGNVMIDGVLYVEYDRIPTRLGAGSTALAEGFTLNAGRTATSDPAATGRKVARAVLLGAGAGIWAWAAYPGWYEDMIDCNKPKVKTDMIYGVAKTNFNAHGGTTPGDDYAVIVCDTETY